MKNTQILFRDNLRNTSLLISKKDIRIMGLDSNDCQIRKTANDCRYYGRTFKYHDGRNWIILELDDDYSEIFKWDDGDVLDNYYFSTSNLQHYRVIKLKNGVYVLKDWDDWQDTLQGGEYYSDFAILKKKLLKLDQDEIIEEMEEDQSI